MKQQKAKLMIASMFCCRRVEQAPGLGKAGVRRLDSHNLDPRVAVFGMKGQVVDGSRKDNRFPNSNETVS